MAERRSRGHEKGDRKELTVIFLCKPHGGGEVFGEFIGDIMKKKTMMKRLVPLRRPVHTQISFPIHMLHISLQLTYKFSDIVDFSGSIMWKKKKRYLRLTKTNSHKNYSLTH